MSTLQIHDTFEPYFDGRKSFPETKIRPSQDAEAARRDALAARKREWLAPNRHDGARGPHQG